MASINVHVSQADEVTIDELGLGWRGDRHVVVRFGRETDLLDLFLCQDALEKIGRFGLSSLDDKSIDRLAATSATDADVMDALRAANPF